MVDAASLLFMAGGASSYPVFFHLSLRKSLSLVSRKKVANGRILLSLIILYLEAVALAMLSTPLSFIPPSFLASLIALSAIVLLASYTLKAMFGLSFRRGVLAYYLWQVLCLALGGLLVVTVIAAMLETVLTFILIIAFTLTAWWMWGNKGLGLKAGSDHLHLEGSDEKIVTIAMVALLASSLVVPSSLCAPIENEVEVDFTWENNGVAHVVGANITWNATRVNATAQGAPGQANGAAEFGMGAGQPLADVALSIINFTSFLYSLHDYKAATTYLSLIDDVTQLQRLQYHYWSGGYLLAASREWRIKTLEQLNKAIEEEDKYFQRILEEFIYWFRSNGLKLGEGAEEGLRGRMREFYDTYPRNIAKDWCKLLIEEDKVEPSDVYLWWGGEPNSDSCYAFLTLFFEVDPDDIGTRRFDQKISRNLRAIINIAENDTTWLSSYRGYEPKIWRVIFS